MSKSLPEKITAELNRLKRRLRKWLGLNEEITGEGQGTPATPDTGEAMPESPQDQGTTKNENLKIHSFGSPNVGKCRLTPDAQIKDFKMDKKGMSYKWLKGGCEQLGAKDKGDASATLAICGYSNDGINYHVTKFDWVSTNRTTRSWENVYDHYNGINPDTFFNATHHCFFICDKHGNYRTNIVTD